MPTSSAETESERIILSVGQLVAGLKALLEDQVGRIFVAGEISNLHTARSGHSYFTLKDEAGQLKAALFRGNASRLRFELEEGLEVVVEAEVSIYAARGDLQLIVRHVEPRGVGALQLAFEQLRKRLQAAGLFDQDRKQEIPEYPRRIGLVTSPTSAAVQDVLKVAGRRFPAIPILISPTLVQGAEAAEEIAKAIERVSLVPDIDVILVVRGGGSLEDLWAFNTETVAHAIANSDVPIITGVGHETDMTIADWVADLRAPTPSAAAMQALPDAEGLLRLIDRDLGRLVSAARGQLESHGLRLDRLREVLRARSPHARLALARSRTERSKAKLDQAIQKILAWRGKRLAAAASGLEALSPLGVLGRGYALVRRGRDGGIVRSASEVEIGDRLDIRLASGRVEAEVLSKDAS